MCIRPYVICIQYIVCACVCVCVPDVCEKLCQQESKCNDKLVKLKMDRHKLLFEEPDSIFNAKHQNVFTRGGGREGGEEEKKEDQLVCESFLKKVCLRKNLISFWTKEEINQIT